jgi:hypothetical protein
MESLVNLVAQSHFFWEDMMSKLKKPTRLKKPGRARPEGGDAGAKTARHHAAPAYDLDAAIAACEAMTPAEVRAALKELNIDPQPTIDAVNAMVRTKLAEWEARGFLHEEETIEPAAFGAVTGGLRGVSGEASSDIHLTAPGRGFFSSRADDASFPAWHDTHVLAEALRHAKTAAAQVAVIRDGFEHLDFAAGALSVHHGADLDAAWPLAECLEELGTAVAHIPALWETYAAGCGEVSARASAAHQCMISHSIKELLDRGPATLELAGMTAREILRHEASEEVRVLLVRLANRDTNFRKRLGQEVDHLIPTGLRHLLVDIESARHEAIEIFPKLRARKAESSYFETPEVKALFARADVDPLSSFLAMYALGDVYVCAGMLIAQDPVERQRAEYHIFSERMLSRLRDDSASHFLTVETFEPFRDRYPLYAASLMAELTESVSARARQALFVCLVEGYEESFRGKIQPIVPRFHLEFMGAPKFVPGFPHSLDHYCERVCSSAIAHDLRPQMEWANQRLAQWEVALT